MRHHQSSLTSNIDIACTMDEPASQLQLELQGSVKQALGIKRPILTHVNADTTWLIQLPYPHGVTPPPGRSRYNILIDPWLCGPQSDVASWFSTQWHAVESSVQTIAKLDEMLKDVEEQAQDPLASTTTVTTAKKGRPHEEQDGSRRTFIDVVAISHEFTDHMHKATLLEIDPYVPVFATSKAASLIRSWNHFHQVSVPAAFSSKETDWRETSTNPLPDWIGISRIVNESDALYYHSAILFTFSLGKVNDAAVPGGAHDAAEAIIYSPHGISASNLDHLPKANPPIKTLALMHGLHDVGITLSKQLNLGAHSGLRAQRICHAMYWVGTHDEVKKGWGVIAPLLRRTVFTFQDAVEREKAEKGHLGSSGLEDMEGVRFAELRNGESLLLE